MGDIVPGRLTEAEAVGLKALKEGEEVVGKIMDELIDRVMDATYKSYLEQQCIPYAVNRARETILQMVQMRFVPQDEGEPHLAEDPTWAEDKKPSPCLIDTWAPGAVPVRCAPYLVGLKKSQGKRQETQARPRRQSDPGSKAEKPRPPKLPVPQEGEVPGELTEVEVAKLRAREEGEEVVGDIVEELMDQVMDAACKSYLERQCIPYAVNRARETILQMVQMRFVPRDEGEPHLAEDPTWAEDEEPSPCPIDTWARGAVPLRGPCYHLLAHTTLTLAAVQDGFRTHDLTLASHASETQATPDDRVNPVSKS
ncbi:uncharacterized protein Cadr_000018333 [Camelus dromedarius]|uniref:Uncharacterized protein n=1 Tax=Camelus dromedarius TaxID=9838 RepID=A0A5N4D6R8_CAMDR|nr:uncharacterized protein Cadr_000018333 [Camelus dromedarius]